MVKSVYPENSQNFGDPIKYDPDFKGPLSRRSCTDILCLGLFVIFILCWIAIGIFAVTSSSPDLLLIPTDSKGRKCGHDTDVKDKPYLLFFDLTQCIGPQVLITGCKTTQVCVKNCPTETFKRSWENRNKLVCEDSFNPPANEAVMKEKCAPWIIASKPVFGRCLPTVLEDLTNIDKKLTADKIADAVKNVRELAAAGEVITLVTQDLIQSWWKILLGLLGAMVVCLIYIILMRWVAGIMVWLSIIGVIVLLSVGVYMTAMKYKTLLNSSVKSDAILEQTNFWLALLIIVSILLAICLLILIFLRKRILIAIALIKEASKAVSSVTSTLFFPISPWILQVLVVAYAIVIGLYLSSVGERKYQIQNAVESGCSCGTFLYKNNQTCIRTEFDNHCKIKSAECSSMSCDITEIVKPSYIKALHAYNIVGGFWGVFFMSAFGEMVLAATFATWYWTFRKSDVPFFTLTSSIVLTLRYHVGTLAFGSLIITICRLIRVMIEYVDHKLKKYDNPFTRAVMCCCKCFFWCLEKFLRFINKNAYIMCAIHGRNFCMSAKDAFSLLMRNVVRVFVVDKVTDMLLFLAKILVTAIVAIIAYTAFTNANFNVVDAKDLHYVLVPVIVIAIGAFFISSVFFGVYSMAVDTLFLCFLEDCERNDGSPDKPYYMSKELMRILGKKNKMS